MKPNNPRGLSFYCDPPASIDELLGRGEERPLDNVSPQVHPSVQLKTGLALVDIPTELRRINAFRSHLHIVYDILTKSKHHRQAYYVI